MTHSVVIGTMRSLQSVHDVIGTGRFHLRAISEAVWSHGLFTQRWLFFRLEDVTSAEMNVLICSCLHYFVPYLYRF